MGGQLIRFYVAFLPTASMYYPSTYPASNITGLTMNVVFNKPGGATYNVNNASEYGACSSSALRSRRAECTDASVNTGS